jgi:hypothetical protein
MVLPPFQGQAMTPSIDKTDPTYAANERKDNDDAVGNPASRPSHDDSPLESIGKAVSEPVRDAADEDSDEPAQRHPGR